MLSAVVSNESDLPKLESIQTGDTTFTNVHSFQLRGLYTRELSVIDLPKLESIQTGDTTFTKASSLELKGLYTRELSVIDLPCLQSLKIGYGFCSITTAAFESCFPAVA